MTKIVSIKEFKAQKLTHAIQAITAGMSDADLHVLQNDVMSPPLKRSMLPDGMRSTFREWLNDSYGEMEREEKMAPEAQIETERQCLEESLDSDDEVLAAQARMLLMEGQLGPIALDAEDESKQAPPDAPLA